VYHHWLFDRTTCYYKMYVRTGERRYLEAAHRAATFVRTHTEMKGPDAGAFTLKGPDVKYVYPRAMHLHYLLTGDERARRTGEVMARYCFERWEPGYRPELYRPVSPDVDPEAGRRFWSLRHAAYGFLGALHGSSSRGGRSTGAVARSMPMRVIGIRRRLPTDVLQTGRSDRTGRVTSTGDTSFVSMSFAISVRLM
jgi:hypothetical protein